ncbi:flagellar hook-associated protein 1 FlgK [Poseidonocella pacifica]|uniref:Flagellar hook-associated protein 1 n=1 Tax=Poseidonocella pacifica TaxID=871651 RepID=A0A1I0XXY9_9RHOB|nr:flagellar hook-associated protein FlgK [Poseidonocella pacifica]SFB05170.1 flagellar hook-associated protein 1 FlgK [Poseidonocella pacifica]
MSISSSLQNALSGLTAAAKSAQAVSSNMSNVMTEGYGVREVGLSANSSVGSGGVKVTGIIRNVDPVVLADRRVADAELANKEVLSAYMTRLEGAFGIPDDADSLTAQMNSFESALIAAASRPDSEPRLRQVHDAAVNLTDTMNGLSEDIQTMRAQADRAIENEVTLLNQKLEQVQLLNRQITRAVATGGTTAALHDQRQTVIDDINEIVPVKLMSRPREAVALLSAGGMVLLDTNPVEIDFTASNAVEADMTLDAGSLSALYVNGNETNGTDSGQLGGGKLSALFNIRDDMMVEAQGKVDALARDLMERFEDTDVDFTLTAGDPGLFTDKGNAFDASLELGVAARIQINDSVNPDEGGEIWRFRDGVNAVAQGNSGMSDILQAGARALAEQVSPNSPNASAVARTSSAMASDILSFFGVARQGVEADVSFAAARQNELSLLQMEGGVDTDQETQKLMLIEQSYQANARVIQVIDEMMDAILRI